MEEKETNENRMKKNDMKKYIKWHEKYIVCRLITMKIKKIVAIYFQMFTKKTAWMCPGSHQESSLNCGYLYF